MVAILCLAVFKLPSYLVFIFGCILIFLIEQEDVKGYCVYAGVIMFLTNLVSVIFGILFGLIRL